ncbi:MAG: Hpt domain-containing protein [Turneriella sp.]|nr:Hpt domain-containing protein [Turneriella sp.]
MRPELAQSAEAIFRERLLSHRQLLNKIMAFVLFFNWALGVVFAVTVSPSTWIGAQKLVNLHVWIAIGQGAVMAVIPALLVWLNNSASSTRHIIAMSQCLFASLFVHLTGGRIETHFYYFASLAFLAFYRDWKIVLTGTVFIAVDHLARGIFWPQSVFGITAGIDWRWVEHAAWVVVMDVVLFMGVIIATREVRQIAEQKVVVDNYAGNMEQLVTERTAQLQVSQKETQTVLDSIDEGLFVIFRKDNGYEIGAQQSAAVRGIFGETLPATRLTEALTPFLSPLKVRELENYLTLLQSASIRNEMIADLNPLESIHTAIRSLATEKYLQFIFSAVEPGKQDQYLVRVRDVTKATHLQQQLAANEKKNEENTQMILSVLHIGPGLLEDFIEGVEIELAIIENILQSDQTPQEVMARMEELFRSIHSIKGNSALLDLKILTSVAHEFEEKVIQLRSQHDPGWSDFIPLAKDVLKLQSTLAGLKDLLLRLQNFKSDTGGDTDSAVAAIPKSVRTMAERLAQELDKQVVVDTDGYEASGIPNKFAYILRDISVQMVRNSIAHGLETPEARKLAGKSSSGKIVLTLRKEGNEFLFTIRDDGKSFDFETIRRMAMKKYNTSPDIADAWDQKKLIRIIFEPGFSTAETATLTAGRGMGLDIVRQRIKKVGGELKINFSAGKFTEFNMRIPLDA